ncbi:septum formation initiator family protein [Mycolicibacterium sp. S2-37]|uniref:septum formation initiator family protein n=1 Tax=Mycolicibacterium sp. S2-37 TaxID=2810297 RepID=UPI001A94E82D|nr:septum formation initiator family protein [Mycolicibacterium sp. S2-37]MBO0679373.1 septum formation initiator family protein [Mycolicibacterium sp. S2-37]
MPESKRPDPKRRSPASSRPGKPGAPGGAARGRPKTTPQRREPRAIEPRPPADAEEGGDGGDGAQTVSVGRSIMQRAEELAARQSEQRFGSAARRAAILAAVVCVLTLTIAGPVRTYFAQRTEMRQLQATEEQLRAQIADLEEQKIKLADPVFIAAQARERLGFVMPGDIPFEVQLPPGAIAPGGPEAAPETAPSGQPWYTALWKTIADEPHGLSPVTPLPGAPPGPPPPPPAFPPPGG